MIPGIIFYSAVTFLSVCGLFSILIYLRLLFDDFSVLKGRTVYTVVGVKNDEKSAEGIARALLFKSIVCDSGICDSRVVLVDMGSEDKTEDIIRRMEKENSTVSFMTGNELKSSINLLNSYRREYEG